MAEVNVGDYSEMTITYTEDDLRVWRGMAQVTYARGVAWPRTPIKQRTVVAIRRKTEKYAKDMAQFSINVSLAIARLYERL